MSRPKFKDLPFNARPDLTPYLLHLTKNTMRKNQFSGFENLVNILETGRIRGSKSSEGFIKGKRRAACFMDVPFASLKYVLTPENADPIKPRYEPYGLIIRKQFAYRKGARPVLYLSNAELRKMDLPADELWRVVRLEFEKKRHWINWLHEREWRCPDRFKLPRKIQAVLVRDADEAVLLRGMLEKKPKKFACSPKSIIPLEIVCQGLLPDV